MIVADSRKRWSKSTSVAQILLHLAAQIPSCPALEKTPSKKQKKKSLKIQRMSAWDICRAAFRSASSMERRLGSEQRVDHHVQIFQGFQNIKVTTCLEENPNHFNFRSATETASKYNLKAPAYSLAWNCSFDLRLMALSLDINPFAPQSQTPEPALWHETPSLAIARKI